MVVLFYLRKAAELKEKGIVVTCCRKLSDSCALSIAYLDPFWPQIGL